MKGLVFGKTGQVGRCLAHHLRALETTSFLDREQADLTRPETLRAAIETLQPDVVINAAAYTAVDKAESEPDLAHTVNTEAPAAMAQACAATGAWLVHYSTDYVFDGEARQAYSEDDRVAPGNVYGRTKLAGEEGIRAAHDRHLILRTSWVYSNFGANFLNTMLRLADEGRQLKVVDDQIGAPTYAGAIAEATGDILRKLAVQAPGDAGMAGTYHLSCAGSTSWYGFACRIFELNACRDDVQVSPIPTVEYPTPAPRPLFSVLSNAKLHDVFGVELPSWDDALRKCLSEREAGE